MAVPPTPGLTLFVYQVLYEEAQKAGGIYYIREFLYTDAIDSGVLYVRQQA